MHQCNVLYVCAEGVGGFRNRTKAYGVRHGVDLGGSFQTIAAAPNFLDPADVDEIIAEARRIGAGLIVLDTLAQVTPGGDENSAAEMGKVIAQCRRLHEATGAMVVLVHHASKDANRGARGWSGIRAAVDVEIEVAALPGGGRVARVTKMKDGQEGGEFGFKLVPLSVGFDNHGDDIKSCYVEPAEVERTKPKGPTGQAGDVWKAYHELAQLPGTAVDTEALITAVVAMWEPPASGKEDRRRDNAKRALKKLTEGGLLVEEGGVVRASDTDS